MIIYYNFILDAYANDEERVIDAEMSMVDIGRLRFKIDDDFQAHTYIPIINFIFIYLMR